MHPVTGLSFSLFSPYCGDTSPESSHMNYIAYARQQLSRLWFRHIL